MKKLSISKCIAFLASLVLLLMPAAIRAESATPQSGPPPISQQLAREGAYAVKLVSALGLGTIDDETEAESKLGEVGIVPRNGWIADYPVTPDIIGEIRQSVGSAADAGKLSMKRDEVLKRLDDVDAELGLAIKPYSGKNGGGKPTVGENYPNPTVINNYYYNEGPPVVTYYQPPPDYYYMYAWVPYPFWWTGFWFPGFFILNDFHRVVVIDRRVVFVSNHFNDARIHRVFRVDPVARFRGRTFAGIGVAPSRSFISTGVPRSERTIFNGPRPRTAPSIRTLTPPSRVPRSMAPSMRGPGSSSPAVRGSSMGGGQSSHGERGFSPRERR